MSGCQRQACTQGVTFRGPKCGTGRELQLCNPLPVGWPGWEPCGSGFPWKLDGKAGRPGAWGKCQENDTAIVGTQIRILARDRELARRVPWDWPTREKETRTRQPPAEPRLRHFSLHARPAPLPGPWDPRNRPTRAALHQGRHQRLCRVRNPRLPPSPHHTTATTTTTRRQQREAARTRPATLADLGRAAQGSGLFLLSRRAEASRLVGFLHPA